MHFLDPNVEGLPRRAVSEFRSHALKPPVAPRHGMAKSGQRGPAAARLGRLDLFQRVNRCLAKLPPLLAIGCYGAALSKKEGCGEAMRRTASCLVA